MNLLPNSEDVTYTRSRCARAVNGTWYTLSADWHDIIGVHVLMVDGRKVATILPKVDSYSYAMSCRGNRNIWSDKVSDLMAKAEAMIAESMISDSTQR